MHPAAKGSVHDPVPLGKAVNQHLQAINLLCNPSNLLIPQGSGEVNAMLILGITDLLPWERCLTSPR